MSFDDKALDGELSSSIFGSDFEAQDDNVSTSLGGDDSAQGSNDEGADDRPQHSPYASDIVALQFSPRQTLRIPRQFLLKTPLIVRLALSETPGTLDLGSIKFDAGHVIVNFLVTGGYQCLQPWGITPTEKYASEFRTALRVYVAAESLGLTDLFNLAQDEVERVGDKLSFPQVVDNVHFLDPFHAHLPWVGEYVQSRMVSFWENTTVEQASEMVSDVLGPSNLHKILIGGLLKMKASESTIGKDQANQTTAGATGTSWSRMFQEAEATWEGTAKPVREADDLTQHNMAQQVPALTCKRELYEVEFEASYEDNKMRQLISEKENSRLVLSKEVQELLNRLIRESGRRAEVLAAQEAADQVENKHERAHLHFHLAVNQHAIYRHVWENWHSTMENVILFRALRKEYHSERLEALARRKRAVELYRPSALEARDSCPGPFSDTTTEVSSCSSLSTGQQTPESGDGLSTAEMCWEMESHLTLGGAWRDCAKCTNLVQEAVRDLVTLPELNVGPYGYPIS